VRLKIAEDIGYWELPKPPKGKEKEWHKVVRLGNTNKGIPYGYKVCYDNDALLEPIPYELEALELAKSHLKQYSYADVCIWLEKQTGRPITQQALRRRVDIDLKRKKATTAKRFLAQRLQKILKEIETLEKNRIGAYSTHGEDEEDSTSDSATSSV
tara:strand:- start:100 stop:567 length:468 start_codon:yes stop_codon:yes gene_type:complete